MEVDRFPSTMTFSISVTGTTEDEQTTRRVQSALQRFWMEVQRSGAAVTSVTVGGFPEGAGESFKPFKSRVTERAIRSPVQDHETGQPGAKSALEMSVEAGTTSTSSQPEPAPTGPVKERATHDTTRRSTDSEDAPDVPASRSAKKAEASKEAGSKKGKSDS